MMSSGGKIGNSWFSVSLTGRPTNNYLQTTHLCVKSQNLSEADTLWSTETEKDHIRRIISIVSF